MDEFRKLESLTWSELALLMSCRLLCMTKHSKMFIEEQKKMITELGVSRNAKELCLQTLDLIEPEGAK